MNKEVNFEIAKLLKEKGFDTPTNRYYEHALTSKKDPETNDYKGAFGWKKGETNLRTDYFKNNYGMADLSTKNWYICSAPTISEVVMWLYEKHDVWVSVEKQNRRLFKYRISNIDTFNDSFSSIERSEFNYEIPTEAYEAAIKYILENLI